MLPMHLVIYSIMRRRLFTVPLLLTATAAAVPSCPTTRSRSCTPAAESLDSCCVASPGGRFEFTQRFEPDVGSQGGSWGIESLKVMTCNGQALASSVSTSYSHEQVGSYCASSPAFASDGGFELAEKEWAQSEVGESVEEVWERAWANSGRFTSTLQAHCLTGYKTGDEVPLFFEAIHRLHRSLPSAKRLSEADITPSADTTYSISELEAAVSIDGFTPYFGCINTTLSTITYPLFLLGKFQDAQFQAADSIGRQGNCPSEGIRYPPSAILAPTSSTQTWDPVYRPSPRAITLSEDPQKRLQPTTTAPAKKLGFFKAKGEKYEQGKGADVKKSRDEL